MQRTLAGWLLLTSPIALAQEEPGESQTTAESPVEIVVWSLQITTSGQYILNGTPTSRTELLTAVQGPTGQQGQWDIYYNPGTASHHTASVVDLLSREGIENFSIATSSANPPEHVSPPPEEEAPTVVVPQRPIQATADVRFGAEATGLGSDDGELATGFVINRAAAGASADIGAHIEALVLLEVIQADSGDMSAGVRDAWVSFPLEPSGFLSAKVGRQVPIFGHQPWHNDDTNGFYTVGGSFGTLPVLAGLISSRTDGVVAQAQVQDSAGQISAMISNSSGLTDSSALEGSARIQYRLLDPLTVVASGLSRSAEAEVSGGLLGAMVGVRLDTKPVDVLLEGLSGTADDTPFIGGSGTIALSAGLPVKLLDSVRFSARGAYFDPSLPTEDADAWFLGAGGLMVRWKSMEATTLLSGVGLEVEVPMDATAPVEQRALIETHILF